MRLPGHVERDPHAGDRGMRGEPAVRGRRGQAPVLALRCPGSGRAGMMVQSPEPPVVALKGVRKAYPLRGGGERLALADVSFDVARGEFACVVGPSGAGKTTLLRCLAGLAMPTSGAVEFEGMPLRQVPAGGGVVFQGYGRSLFPWLTVRGNVDLALKARGVARDSRPARIAEVLASVGLADVGRSYPWQLSGGMQQRVAIARALACRPDLLLMDEPFASVDAQTRFGLEDLILRVRHELCVTGVFVTHESDESVYLARRLIL